MSAGRILLHEIAHVVFADAGTNSEDPREEEFRSDEWAVREPEVHTRASQFRYLWPLSELRAHNLANAGALEILQLLSRFGISPAEYLGGT